MKQGTRPIALTAAAAAVILAAAGCTSGPAVVEQPSSTPTPTVEATAPEEPDELEEPAEPVVTDPDQLRYYEAMRAAPGWESMSMESLDEIAQATCTSLRDYTGAPALGIGYMTATFTEELGDYSLAEAAVEALVARWCPDVLD